VPNGIPVTTAAIILDRLGGDVWAWEKQISGICPDCPPEATIALLVNGASVPAERAGDAFSAIVKLDPGENEVVAVAAMLDGSEERSAPVPYTVQLEPRPTARLTATIEGDRLVFDGASSTPSDYDGASISTWKLEPLETNPQGLNVQEHQPGRWSIPLPKTSISMTLGEYFVSLVVGDERGRTDRATVWFEVYDGSLHVPDPVHDRAGWIPSAVVYGVVPSFFDPPTFQGVTARLEDLANLGISALWFAPITATPPSDYGYAVTDYFNLRPEYGTKADFKALVDAAHERDIRVLMDFVPNHSSDQHPYFQDALEHGESSNYWDFYDRDAGGNPTHYFSWTHLPNLNYANPEVQRFMLEAFAYWVREFDVDGFRIDAVWGIKERNPEWLDRFLAEMNRIKPDTLLIAEASARDEFYTEHGFDAAYDWTDELGQWAWGEAIGGIAPIGEAMVDVLTDGGQGYHPEALVMRFLNNNDTGPRFVTTYGPDFYRAALAMLLTLPGLPCLFTGDEVGAEYQPYETSGPIAWTDHYNLHADVRKLIQIRWHNPALYVGEWQPLTAEPAVPLFTYLRNYERDSTVLVILNFSGDDLEAVVDLPRRTSGRLRVSELTDLWSGEAFPPPSQGKLMVPVPGWGFRFLAPKHG
jgi:cyclomaltodextrinase